MTLFAVQSDLTLTYQHFQFL